MNAVEKMKADAARIGEISRRDYLMRTLALIDRLQGVLSISDAEEITNVALLANRAGHEAGIQDSAWVLAELVKATDGDRAKVLGIAHQALLDLNARNKASR